MRNGLFGQGRFDDVENCIATKNNRSRTSYGGVLIRPRAISGIPAGLDETASPGERFKEFVRMVLSVPKTEADEEIRRGKTARTKGAKGARYEGHKQKG